MHADWAVLCFFFMRPTWATLARAAPSEPGKLGPGQISTGQAPGARLYLRGPLKKRNETHISNYALLSIHFFIILILAGKIFESSVRKT